MHWATVLAGFLTSAGGDTEGFDAETAFALDESHVAFESGIYIEDDITSASFVFDGRFAVGDMFSIRGALPAAFVSGGNRSSFQMGNLELGGAVRGAISNRWMLEGGLALGLPTSQIDEGSADSLAALVALSLATNHRGLWDIHLWSPESFSLRAPLRLEFLDPSGFFVDGHFEVLLVAETFDGGATTYLLKSAGEVGYRGSRAEVGLRFGVVGLFNESGEEAQTHVQPRARLYLLPRGESPAPYFQWRLVLNLDTPAGFDRPGGAIVGNMFSLGLSWR